jgi:pyridoxine 5-phosphate synthase
MARAELGLNIDYVGTLRQGRRTRYPDPIAAASVAERAGASQIKAHLREDRRHIQDRDLLLLRDTVETTLNMQMAATQENQKLAYEVKPHMVTIVPERSGELATESGLDIGHHREHLKKYIGGLREAEILVSLFVDPDVDQIRGAHKVETMAVEINTRHYADARDEITRRAELQKIVDASRAANKLGMYVSAGHGIHYHNIQELVAVDGISRFNVGHSIISRALFSGLECAVRDMIKLLDR